MHTDEILSDVQRQPFAATQLIPMYSVRLCANSANSLLIFTVPCYSNGAVLPSYHVCLSVCPSVTLVDCDHICWATWNFITWLISPVSSLATCKISGNIGRTEVGWENWRFSTDKSSYLRNGER